MEPASVIKAIIRMARYRGGRRAGRFASSARQAGPSLGLAFIDACEQQAIA